MTRDELTAWALQKIRERHDEFAAFYVGAYHAALGTFREEHCGPVGWIGESLYCEGGREGLQRLEAREPAQRIGHGQIVEERA
jgi:hypothetical protein